MTRTLGKMTMLALAFSGYTTVTGCSGRDRGNTPAPSTLDSTGSINLALQLVDGTTIQNASYTITGPNGFMKSGTINLASSSKLTALIAGLPAGANYQIAISAMSTDGSVTCGGSAKFDVMAGQTASVTVPLTCKQAPKTGSVLVSGVLNLCPTIDGIGANPAEVQVGGTIALSGSAHDSDVGPAPLGFAWTATGGTLSDATAANPTFTCATPGPATVTLKVTDGDPAESCAATQTAQVNCSAVAKTPGTYVAGDVHNHTTCSDGSISMQKLVKKSTDKMDTPWGLDWFVQAGHGGNGNRNCTLVEDATLATPAYPLITGQGPTTTWVNSGITPKGDVSGSGANRNMWRWQSLQEIQYPLIEYLNALKNLPLFLGVESVVAGHEHTSMSVITGQIPAALNLATLPTAPPYVALGNASPLAQWEYCFDRGDGDTSRGAANQWDCAVPGSANETDPSWNAVAKKLIPAGGTGTGDRGHNKTVEALKWMAAFHPEASYYLPTHLERAGQFNPNGNNGFNVEHLRNFNNAAPKVAFGFETQPGHGASDNRGEYQVLRNNIGGVQTDSVGGTTYGGTGVYGGQIGGVWDALLGEGRNFWFFASSDWHNRGSFGPDDRRSSQDFYPGEYQRNYTMVRSTGKLGPQAIVDGLRTGNTFTSSGQIIDRFALVACIGTPARPDALVAQMAATAAINNTAMDFAGCATMGEKLLAPAGSDIVVGIAVRDPAGTNYSPYTFPNPSLLQVGINQPMNMPVLDHIDLIRGLVSGYRTPGTPGYSGEWPRNLNWLKADGTTADLSVVPDAAKNVTAGVIRTFNGSGAAWSAVTSHIDGSTFLTMVFRIPAVTASQYVRVRGTNLPAAVPFETDASGNPLADVYTNANDRTRLRIPCTTVHSPGNQFDGCPDHMSTATGASNPILGQKAVTFDVAAWADLWFYSNPVYIEVAGSTVVAGVK
jgi:hypothetical protein